MFGLSTLERLLKLLEDEPILQINKTVNGRCVYIQANPPDNPEGLKYLNKIKQWVDHGEYPCLSCINVFEFHPLNTIRVCHVESSFYEVMCDCINETERNRPYED